MSERPDIHTSTDTSHAPGAHHKPCCMLHAACSSSSTAAKKSDLYCLCSLLPPLLSERRPEARDLSVPLQAWVVLEVVIENGELVVRQRLQQLLEADPPVNRFAAVVLVLLV